MQLYVPLKAGLRGICVPSGMVVRSDSVPLDAVRLV